MADPNIILPAKPKVINEDERRGIYEIDGLYPGYGHTLGNSLRRIILSSLVGTAITAIKIDGVTHEFATIEGVKEDIIMIILNLKKVKFKLFSDEPVSLRLRAEGARAVEARDIDTAGLAEVINPDAHIAAITDKKTSLDITLFLRRGLGYLPKEALAEEHPEVGTIYLDAVFTPIRRASYEVENMRVGDRTDYNRLRLQIETDGTLTPREALTHSIEIMITQLQAIVGFRESEPVAPPAAGGPTPASAGGSVGGEVEPAKIKIADLGLSTRVARALEAGGVKTLAGLARKKEEDLRAVEGLGDKGVTEIKRVLTNFGLILK